MLSKGPLTLLAPLSAAMMLWASLTPYRVMEVIAQLMDAPEGGGSAVGRFVVDFQAMEEAQGQISPVTNDSCRIRAWRANKTE